MPWKLKCSTCGVTTRAREITVLMHSYRDEQGMFRCGTCGAHAGIDRVFDNLQGRDEVLGRFSSSAPYSPAGSMTTPLASTSLLPS